jgi:hypothetical protein
MRGIWWRTLTQLRNPGDVPGRRRTLMTRPLRRLLSALRRERAVREEIERLAGEQAALRRVATLVAKAAAPEEIFSAVAAEQPQSTTPPDSTDKEGRTRGLQPEIIQTSRGPDGQA